MSSGYWRGAAEDEAMQDEHGFLWLAMLDTIDVELGGRRVLDAGCNRGGFLRLLVDRCDIAQGAGYDPAASAIDDARRLAGARPLRFEVASNVPQQWSGFDVAFSHEVLYLLEDLGAHARAVARALVPGGVYFAALGMHAGSPLMVRWHAAHAAELGLPRLYDIDEVVGAFQQAGFAASLGRLRLGFVPVTTGGHHEGGSVTDWMRYYTEEKFLLRFALGRGS